MSSPTISIDLQNELFDVIRTSPKSLPIDEIKTKWEKNGNNWSDEIVKLAELYHIQLQYLEKSIYSC